jgi:tetratricopeptide (TPR) repeat protein
LARTLDRPAQLGNFLWVSAEVFQQRGDLDEAVKAIHESVRFLDPGPAWNTQQGQTHNFILALIYEGRILGGDNLISVGRSEDAVRSLEHAFRVADYFVHQDTNNHMSRGHLAMAAIAMGGILRHSDARRALDVYDHTLRDLADARGDVHLQRYEIRALTGSSYPMRRLGRPAGARQRLDAAFARLRQLKLYPAEKIEPGSAVDTALCALADHAADTGEFARAIEIYQELLDRLGAGPAKPATRLSDAVDLSHIFAAMAGLHRRAGHTNAASALEARRRDLWQQWDRKLPQNAFVLRQLEAANPL